MEFRPQISPQLKLMDARIFPRIDGATRRTADPAARQAPDLRRRAESFFVNFDNLEIRRTEQIDNIRRLIGEKLGKLDHKVHAIINYDNFSIAPELLDAYVEMVRRCRHPLLHPCHPLHDQCLHTGADR